MSGRSLTALPRLQTGNVMSQADHSPNKRAADHRPSSHPKPSSKHLVQRIGAIAWPSFFSAGVMTMVFFSIVDPMLLREITFPALVLSRELGYTLGFFMFWLATASSSLFTWLLLRRPSSHIERPLSE